MANIELSTALFSCEPLGLDLLTISSKILHPPRGAPSSSPRMEVPQRQSQVKILGSLGQPFPSGLHVCSLSPREAQCLPTLASLRTEDSWVLIHPPLRAEVLRVPSAQALSLIDGQPAGGWTPQVTEKTPPPRQSSPVPLNSDRDTWPAHGVGLSPAEPSFVLSVHSSSSLRLPFHAHAHLLHCPFLNSIP